MYITKSNIDLLDSSSNVHDLNIRCNNILQVNKKLVEKLSSVYGKSFIKYTLLQ